jgi:hypothetical protein
MNTPEHIDFLGCVGTSHSPELELDYIELGHRVADSLDSEYCGFGACFDLQYQAYLEGQED